MENPKYCKYSQHQIPNRYYSTLTATLCYKEKADNLLRLYMKYTTSVRPELQIGLDNGIQFGWTYYLDVPGLEQFCQCQQ